MEMIERPEIQNYLPHKDSMLLLDRIVDYDLENSRLVSEVDTTERDLFYRPEMNGVPSWVGFEYMAQSIAALSGVAVRTQSNDEPKIGFIMSIRAFKTSVPSYPAETNLKISVSQIFREDSVVVFECAISIDSEVVTTATVNAIEVDSVSALLGELK